MSDINNPFIKYYSTKANYDEEGHPEPAGDNIKTNIKDYEHPIFSENGLVQTINFSRNLSNTSEKELTGKVDEQVLEDVANASRKTGILPNILFFALDWKTDITSLKSGTEAKSIADKMIGYANELRSSLGRDPNYGELFCAYACGSAGKVKTIFDNAEQKPDEEAEPPGTQKDDIAHYKLRNGKSKKRTNKELYLFFMNRAGAAARVHFKKNVGKIPS